MSKWIDIINSIAEQEGFSCEFYRPATEEELIIAEKKLNCQFPNELREFLKETNGFLEYIHIKDEIIPNIQLIWSIEQIVEINLGIRIDSVYDDLMPLNSLLFFAAPGGDGILYGYGVGRNGIVSNRIFYWVPLTDSRILLAQNLEQALLEHYKYQI